MRLPPGVGVTDRFALGKHDGPYETWPLTTPLWCDGRMTACRVAGYELLHQFEVPGGYLLITDWDCPFEEGTDFTLLSPDLRVLSHRGFMAPYASWSLERVEWMAADTLLAYFYGGGRGYVHIRPWGIPYLRPRLILRRLPPARDEDA